MTTIYAKYDLNDVVFFLFNTNSNIPTKIELYCGIIKQVNVLKSIEGLEISYVLDVCNNDGYTQRELEINENYLFENEKDLFKLFKENIRSYLNPDNIKNFRRMIKEEDDLPF